MRTQPVESQNEHDTSPDTHTVRLPNTTQFATRSPSKIELRDGVDAFTGKV